MAGILLTVLEIFGYALLFLLLLLIVLILIVFFSSFKYSFSGAVNDPEGSSEILHLNLKKDLECAAEVSWLLGLVQASLLYDGETHLKLKLAGIRVAPEKLMKLVKKDEKKKEKPKEEQKKEKLSIDEKIEKILSKIEKIYYRIDDAIGVLNTDYGCRAKRSIMDSILPPVISLLPSQWGLAGVVGLGDPSHSAKVFSVQGLLYPITAGHVAVGTEYELYRYDLRGAAKGSLRLCSFVWAAIRIVLNKDVRRLLKRLRRGPNHSGKNGNGRKSSARDKGHIAA